MDKYKAFYDMVKKWTVSDYRTQKIKAEVIVDMLISDYIEEIMSQSFGKIKLIAKEFPIARIGQASIEKEGDTSSNRQYASVDFLMSGNEFGKSTLYLVELKTSDDSVDGVQLWNMLWTCSQGGATLYNRFYDVIVNYGINDHGNDLSIKKYQYTLSKYAVNHGLKKCETGIKSFGMRRPQKATTENRFIKMEQTNTAIDILSNLKKSFNDAKLQIVYVGLSDNIDFFSMSQSAFNERSIQEKIAKNDAVKDFFKETAKIRINGSNEDIAADISSFIIEQNIEKILLTDFKPSEEKKNEWQKIKDILVELKEEPWGEAWFDVNKMKKLRGDNS